MTSISSSLSSQATGGASPIQVVTAVGLALTIVAFLLAIFQVLQARSQSRNLQTHEVSLRAIAASLSTRYIGPFPDYLATAIALIDRAKSDLLIVNDNPVPAYFSAPLTWIDYRRAVDVRIHSGVSVTLISITDAQRLRRMRDQFKMSPEEWPDWLARNKALIDTFMVQQYPNEATSGDIDQDRFLEMLVETQKRLTADLFAHAKRIEADAIVTLQVWIADKREAVFSIETNAENSLSHGLYTSDPEFVAALYAMAELYRTSWTA
jgi:hypothetical protein